MSLKVLSHEMNVSSGVSRVNSIYVYISVNNILFKYKVHRDTTDTSYIQYNTFERDTEISLRLV